MRRSLGLHRTFQPDSSGKLTFVNKCTQRIRPRVINTSCLFKVCKCVDGGVDECDEVSWLTALRVAARRSVPMLSSGSSKTARLPISSRGSKSRWSSQKWSVAGLFLRKHSTDRLLSAVGGKSL